MLKLIKDKGFEKDIKVLEKKHYKFDRLATVLEILMEEQPIPGKYRDHSLLGNLKGYRECHIESDLLLIYRVVDDNLVLYRLSTHRDIYGK